MDEYAEELMGSGTMLGCHLDDTNLTWISCEMTDMVSSYNQLVNAPLHGMPITHCMAIIIY